MPAPKADSPKCDVFGCGMPAVSSTDGTELDAQDLARKSVPHLNICGHHTNWPFSHDAEVFATSDIYRKRA